MRLKVLIGSAAIALALTLTACSGQTDAASAPSAPSTSAASPSTSAASPSASSSSASASGTFDGLNGKKVAGTVTIDAGTVTLSGFSSDEGPDLHIYLTDGTDEAAVSAGTELGAVSFDTASQTFSLGSADVSAFTDVVIHCDKAKAVFGAAPLT